MIHKTTTVTKNFTTKMVSYHYIDVI